MITEISKVNYNFLQEDLDIIEKCANIIYNGGIVAFPTETVYGLGANAFLKDAVKKIYIAKNRPLDNPLIVHISNIKTINTIAKNISKEAKLLMKNFWPGPLTLILEKQDIIPDIVSNGLNSVAVRIPSNKIARILIEKSKVPIAAPSANISGKPSSTKASHVIEDLNNKIDYIIDGGECEIGLESTVVDVRNKPIILRPGSITIDMIRSVIKKVEVDDFLENKVPICPGMKYKHYSPNANIIIISGKIEHVIKKIKELSNNYDKQKIGIITCDENKNFYDITKKYQVVSLGSINNSQTIAKNLFKSFRKFDENNIDIIFSEDFKNCKLGFAIMNRIKKASNYNIIKV